MPGIVARRSAPLSRAAIRTIGGGAGDLLSGLVNPLAYSGVMTSPFFGLPTAAGPPRKIDVGIKIGF